MTDPWQDPALPADVRAADLLARMTTEEKIAQLYSVWPGSNETPGGDMAPLQHALSEEIDLTELLPHGLGQLTRPFGTAPVDPAEGAARLASLQERIRCANRFRLRRSPMRSASPGSRPGRRRSSPPRSPGARVSTRPW